MERLHRTRTLEKIRSNTIQEEKKDHYYKVITSPVGLITLVANDSALIALMWGNHSPKLSGDQSLSDNDNCNSVLSAAEKQLKEYFIGKRTFFDIPLDPKGTEFQKLVWQQLLKIPYGRHITYGEQARRMRRPKSARAVGAANGKNPIGIIIPCHRVLGASGCLTGFAGGIEIKRKLLEIEGVSVKT